MLFISLSDADAVIIVEGRFWEDSDKLIYLRKFMGPFNYG